MKGELWNRQVRDRTDNINYLENRTDVDRS